MTGKKRKPLKEYKRQLTQNVKKYLESRTPRQRLKIIAVMILVLLLADLWIIVRSVSGRPPVRIDHIERIELPADGTGGAQIPDSIGGIPPDFLKSKTDNK